MSISDQELRRTVDTLAVNDSLTVSEKSHISDITFYDSANIITRIDRHRINGFPYQFIEKNRKNESEFRTSLMSRLREGNSLAGNPFHEDWMVFIVLISAFFYASLSAFSKKLFPGIVRFFLFRGVGDPESRGTGELFHWQSTVINLISFFNIALFAYCIASYYNSIPDAVPGILVWLSLLGIVIIALTLRHLTCIFTGSISGKKEVFNEYIVTFYQSYRNLGLILFTLVILLSYTDIFAPRTIIFTGYISFALLYIIRIVRLLLIFLKRNVSVLYLILYLCALEILPVAVIVKYITGLF